MILALLLMLASADPALADIPGLDARVCQMIVGHTPDAGVAYEGGKDVNGKPVVEADINPSPVQMPDVVAIDITVDVARHLGLSVPAGMEATAKVGTLVIGNDGKMTFDGKPLEQPAETALREMCMPQKVQKIKLNNFTE